MDERYARTWQFPLSHTFVSQLWLAWCEQCLQSHPTTQLIYKTWTQEEDLNLQKRSNVKHNESQQPTAHKVCRHFQINGQFQMFDQLKTCLIWLVIANHKGCPFKVFKVSVLELRCKNYTMSKWSYSEGPHHFSPQKPVCLLVSWHLMAQLFKSLMS